MQPALTTELLMLVRHILENAFPSESGAARLKQVGLFCLIYLLQGNDEPVTAARLSQLTGQPDGDVSNTLRRLIELGLVDRTPILQKQGRGRAYKLTVTGSPEAKRLTKAINKAAAARKQSRKRK